MSRPSQKLRLSTANALLLNIIRTKFTTIVMRSPTRQWWLLIDSKCLHREQGKFNNNKELSPTRIKSQARIKSPTSMRQDKNKSTILERPLFFLHASRTNWPRAIRHDLSCYSLGKTSVDSGLCTMWQIKCVLFFRWTHDYCTTATSETAHAN